MERHEGLQQSKILYTRTKPAKQSLVPLNFNAPFEPTPDRSELLAIHLHGWVGESKSGFVFSYNEYARVMSTLNPWMHLLAEILATESFIIAGTSLNEVDLEYYLSFRSEATPRRSRGPSLLIDPNPDAATEADCKRYGLTLVKATMGTFLAWLRQHFPTPPSVAELIVPDLSGLFPDKSISHNLLRFFADFKLMTPAECPKSNLPSPFLYGRAPTKDDLDQHVDIPRTDIGLVQFDVEKIISQVKTGVPKLLIVYDEAGAGKTTVIHRVGYELARRGHPVLSVHTLSRIDAENAIECIASASSVLVVLADGIADHAEQIRDLLQDHRTSDKLVILASERQYRREYVDLIFGDVPQLVRPLQLLTGSERIQLIELFRQYGLVGTPEAAKNPAEFAKRLKDDPIAIAVCRILNDFRPLDAIVESLWGETIEKHRLAYLCVALARHCHVAGIRYSILQGIVGTRESLSEMFTKTLPLGLAENTEDDEYVVPLNAMIAERILHRAALKDRRKLLDAFNGIAAGLSPHVNRFAVMRRSPEARLAGRLFDADKIVKPLLGDSAEELYVTSQKNWEWNSRFWEQRALLVADSNLDNAIHYARYAVAIELHSFTLTTLGKLLIRQMERMPTGRNNAFSEAFDKLAQAIRREESRSRITVHPYSTMFSGATRFLELGESFGPGERAALRAHMDEARVRFAGDKMLQHSLNRLDSLM